MLVLFCHGLESGPQGRKFHALVDAGHDVHAPDCRNRDLGERIEIIASTIAELGPRAVVVGSSFGGIAGWAGAVVARTRGHEIQALVLCAPALALAVPDRFAVAPCCPWPTTIVHGTRDEVCPIEHSRVFARTYGATLIEVDDDHGLSNSIHQILGAVVGPNQRG